MANCNTKKMKEGGKVMNEGMAKLKKAAPEVAKKMGYKKGGSVTRGDGACMKGHTKGKMV